MNLKTSNVKNPLLNESINQREDIMAKNKNLNSSFNT